MDKTGSLGKNGLPENFSCYNSPDSKRQFSAAHVPPAQAGDGEAHRESKRGINRMAVIYVQPDEDLQACLDRAAPGSVIHLGPGVWRQKVMITTPGLRLVGSGAESTALVWGDYAKKPDAQGREYNTFRTWTAAVCADDVSMEDLSIVNDALDPAQRGQEVALTVYGDRFHMVQCTLRSTQDTLFLGPLPEDLTVRYVDLLPPALRENRPLCQSFADCRIEGSVDFIFGCGQARFDRCTIVSVSDGRSVGFVAAPAHALAQEEGFLFSHCRFLAGEGVADGSIFLARPWRDHGLAVFAHCTYGPHIAPAGFDPWRDSGRDRTARFYEIPPVPGRVDWINR